MRTGVLVCECMCVSVRACALLCVRLGTYIVHVWETLGVGSCLPPCLKEGLQLTSACQASWPDFYGFSGLWLPFGCRSTGGLGLQTIITTLALHASWGSALRASYMHGNHCSRSAVSPSGNAKLRISSPFTSHCNNLPKHT